MRPITALFSLFILTALGAGCAVTSADEAETLGASEDDLSVAGKELVGAYVNADKSFTLPSFEGIVLSFQKQQSGNTFVLDVDTGIRCVRAPCPSHVRAEGYFTAGSKTITLHAASVPPQAEALLGRYTYTAHGDNLTLTKDGVSHTMKKASSYCSVPTDCNLQNIIHIMCAGRFTCSEQNSCGYKCGIPVPVVPSVKCMSSNGCEADEFCTTEQGDCESTGMLAVCSGTCAKGARTTQ